jgi:hypothetical protein
VAVVAPGTVGGIRVIILIDKKKQIVAHSIAVALLFWSGCLVFAQESKDPRQSDPYYKAHGGWELRPLQSARKQGKLTFQSDFSATGLERDWKADDVSVELKDCSAIRSVSLERLEKRPDRRVHRILCLVL